MEHDVCTRRSPYTPFPQLSHVYMRHSARSGAAARTSLNMDCSPGPGIRPPLQETPLTLLTHMSQRQRKKGDL